MPWATSFDVRSEREEVLGDLGITMEWLSLPERLTGSELLEYTARLRGMGSEWRERAADLLGVLELDQAPATLIVDYSTGMRKKIGLAVALLHRPRVLVLDEPFEAIDPVSAQAIEDLLRQYVAGAGRCCCPATSWTWWSARVNGSRSSRTVASSLRGQ